jgi:hypothetical protein
MENREARNINNDDGMERSKASGLNFHFGVSYIRSWSQESRLFITRVLKLRNVKRRNPETDTSNHDLISISEFQIPGVGVSKHFTTGIPKCQNVEMRKTPFGVGFGYRELEVSKHFTTGMLKC